MSMHQYFTGQRVYVSTSSNSGPATASEFTIMGRHSVEGGESMYTLRSRQDRRQRMTPGSELTGSGGEKSGDNA
jgi:hypothetical protein